jgi:hypothetical protein
MQTGNSHITLLIMSHRKVGGKDKKLLVWVLNINSYASGYELWELRLGTKFHLAILSSIYIFPRPKSYNQLQ